MVLLVLPPAEHPWIGKNLDPVPNVVFVSAQIYAFVPLSATLRRSVMTFGAFISRVIGALIAGSLAFTLIFVAVHAAEDQRKATVVSFGLFGGQGVFRREATGAAEIVANRFGADQVVVRFNTKTGGDATVEGSERPTLSRCILDRVPLRNAFKSSARFGSVFATSSVNGSGGDLGSRISSVRAPSLSITSGWSSQ
jgi:hypothetical protein